MASTDTIPALAAALHRFRTTNPHSATTHTTALAPLPGGNTRTVLHTTPFPLTITHAHTHVLTTADARTYTDLAGDYTAALYSHTPPAPIASALAATLASGISLGASTPAESAYAALLCARFRLGRVRFCPSGTEANLHAVAGARAWTGRRRVLVFAGGYHGSVLGFAGGVAGKSNVDRGEFVVARYNDLEGARGVIKEDVAAVLVEGMQGAGGCLRGEEGFLRGIREAAREVGAVFVLDEVMTSRMGERGLQGLVEGLEPDLTTLGKYLGGGLAFGAFGGKEEIMAVFDPREKGALAQSGTFNNSVLAMRAGFAGLKEVFTPEVSVAFMATGEAFLKRLREVTEGTKATFTGMGTVMCLHVTDEGVRDIVRADEFAEREDLKELFWLEMLEAGFWIAKRGMIALILGTPQNELDRFVESVEAFLERHRDLFAL